MSNKTFQPGSLVRIISQPSTNPHIVGLVGLICVIEETSGDEMALVNAIDLNGTTIGGGTVPFNCLILEESLPAIRAKLLREHASDEALNEIELKILLSKGS